MHANLNSPAHARSSRGDARASTKPGRQRKNTKARKFADRFQKTASERVTTEVKTVAKGRKKMAAR